MANDRMYIRCKGCGDLHYLAKCYDDGYFTTHEGEELRQGLDDFFDRHKWCYRHKYYGGFELVYESDEDSESEDERIRKELKEAFEAYDIESKWNGIPIRSIFAWLEKQKEPHYTKRNALFDKCVENCDPEVMKEVSDKVDEMLGKEQKPKAKAKSPLSPHELYDAKIEGISQGRQDVIDHPEQFGLQKPAEWSEEDEEMLDIVLTMVDCSTVVPHSGGQLHPSESYKKDISEWLKSCRPSWKPSEEQMAALEAATVRYQSTGLESLYEDLKKL